MASDQSLEGEAGAAKVQAIIDATENMNSSVHSSPSVVLVIGCTGAGKSTYMSYLSGQQCMAREENFQMHIEAENSPFKISCRSVSETTAPGSWFWEEQGLNFIDCPGFQDNRGDVQDITNAYYLKNLFDPPCQDIRVLIVFKLADLQGRVSKFYDLLNFVYVMLKDNPNWTQCLSFLITQTHPRMNQGHIRDIIQGILVSIHEIGVLEVDARQILQKMAEENAPIGLLPVPGIDEVDMPYGNQEHAQELMNIILRTTPIQTPQTHPALSDKSKIFMQGLERTCNINIKKIIESLIKKVNEPNNMGIDELTTLQSQLEPHTVVCKQPYWRHLLEILRPYAGQKIDEIQADINEIEKNVKILDFCTRTFEREFLADHVPQLLLYYQVIENHLKEKQLKVKEEEWKKAEDLAKENEKKRQAAQSLYEAEQRASAQALVDQKEAERKTADALTLLKEEKLERAEEEKTRADIAAAEAKEESKQNTERLLKNEQDARKKVEDEAAATLERVKTLERLEGERLREEQRVRDVKSLFDIGSFYRDTSDGKILWCIPDNTRTEGRMLAYVSNPLTFKDLFTQWIQHDRSHEQIYRANTGRYMPACTSLIRDSRGWFIHNGTYRRVIADPHTLVSLYFNQSKVIVMSWEEIDAIEADSEPLLNPR